MFYTFNQNNSGGSFVFDGSAGISHYVIIEESDARRADFEAEDIGLYFNGCASGRDCSCCGDRWSKTYDLDGSEIPEIDGEDVSDGIYKSSYGGWMKEKPEGYIHYLDGRIVPIRVAEKDE